MIHLSLKIVILVLKQLSNTYENLTSLYHIVQEKKIMLNQLTYRIYYELSFVSIYLPHLFIYKLEHIGFLLL
jgi:hypothetical protein